MKFKGIILDFDGVITNGCKLSFLCHKLFQFFGFSSAPRAMFFVKEVLDFLTPMGFLRGINPSVIRIISLASEKKIFLGIVSDRSVSSLCNYLRRIGIDESAFNFIQGREGFRKGFVGNKINIKNIYCSNKTKPNPGVYDNLVNALCKLDLRKNDIVVIDDFSAARRVTQKLGFKSIGPDKLEEIKIWLENR